MRFIVRQLLLQLRKGILCETSTEPAVCLFILCLLYDLKNIPDQLVILLYQ